MGLFTRFVERLPVGRKLLRQARCDGLQGFLLVKPTPAAALEAWLQGRSIGVAAHSGGRTSVGCIKNA